MILAVSRKWISAQRMEISPTEWEIMCCRSWKPYGTTVLTFLQHTEALSGLHAFGHAATSTSPFHLDLPNLSLRISLALSSPGIHPSPHKDRRLRHVLLDPQCLPLSPLWTVLLHWLSSTYLSVGSWSTGTCVFISPSLNRGLRCKINVF